MSETLEKLQSIVSNQLGINKEDVESRGLFL